MKIKKFLADTLKEGKDRIIAELGDDAIILSSRMLTNPETGKEAYEIVAALDENVVKKNIEKLPKAAEKKPTLPEQQIKALQSAILHDRTNDKLFSYLEDMKDMINELNDNVKYKHVASLSPIHSKLYKSLRYIELSEEYSLNIIGRISTYGIINNLNESFHEARKIIIEGIETRKPLQKTNSQQVVIFIGPTGSGKTTSLVKLAVISKLILKADVLIISADTYKVGGSEQLQTYASIASIPFESVYTPEDLRGLLTKETNRDFVFVDTIGRNPKSKDHIDGLKEYIKASKPDIVYIVHSATSSENSMRRTMKDFSTLGANGIIISKVDEAETMGSIATVLKDFKIPVAYIANGQQIPQDIEPATKTLLGKIILPDDLS